MNTPKPIWNPDPPQTIDFEKQWELVPDNDQFENYDYPTTSPEEPPPVKIDKDIETIIELSPE